MSATDVRKYFFLYQNSKKEILKKKKSQNFDTLHINVNEYTECLNFCHKFNQTTTSHPENSRCQIGF